MSTPQPASVHPVPQGEPPCPAIQQSPMQPDRVTRPRGRTQLPALLLFLPGLLGLTVSASGCSIKQYALRSTADALSNTGGSLSSDDDPELVRDAAPFGLKTMEALAAELPKHRPLRLSLASGFAQYAYAFVQQDADRLEDKDLKTSQVLAARARRLYLRARDYALAGLDLGHAGARKILLSPDRAAIKGALDQMKAEDVPYLYWCAASWGLAISTAKDNAYLIGDLPTVESIARRAIELDEVYDEGAMHELFVSLASSLSKEQGGGPERAKQHMDRAVQLSGGRKLGVLLSYAEGVLVAQQKKAEFVQLAKKVVETNIDADDPAWRRQRLANVIAQRRARWLLDKLGDLFAE